MRRLFFLTAFILLSAWPHSYAAAQPAVEFERLSIEIWPEYDRPDALVIYRITLPAQSSLPAQLSLRIPSPAGQPFSLAYLDVDNLLYNLNFTTTTVDGEWLRINFTAPVQNLQVEYYDPRLTKNGTARSFDYRWAGDYKVRNLSVRVQQPFNASQMAIQPTQGTSSLESDGLTYFTNQVGMVEAGTSFSFKINYSKPDDKLTAEVSSPQPKTSSSNQPASTGSSSKFDATLIAVILAVILVGAGAAWYFMQQRAQAAVTAGKRRHATNRSTIRATTEPDQTVYCHHCGKKSLPGDIFCRSCGARLRFD